MCRTGRLSGKGREKGIQPQPQSQQRAALLQREARATAVEASNSSRLLLAYKINLDSIVTLVHNEGETFLIMLRRADTVAPLGRLSRLALLTRPTKLGKPTQTTN